MDKQYSIKAYNPLSKTFYCVADTSQRAHALPHSGGKYEACMLSWGSDYKSPDLSNTLCVSNKLNIDKFIAEQFGQENFIPSTVAITIR